ncbi:phage portal protein [Leucobacter japonicus]|uniref:phage portal protein n=1 Tax=Leucobacter japonicus TaxID=1461259 RepID=UPI0009E3E4D4|nr:phage portal protein [Leucobacter japonicus]
MMVSSMPFVSGLPDEYRDELAVLFSQLQKKQYRNLVRRRYFDYKAGLKDLGIAIPPQLRNIETVIGWSAKGIEGLVKRSVLDGFTTPAGVDAESIGLSAVWDDNRLGVESRMAHTDAAVASCVFGFVQAGDADAGEPEAVISLKSAEWATGKWDARRRGLSSALSVIDADDAGQVSRFNLYRYGEVVAFRRTAEGWDVQGMRHDLGMPVEVLPHKPSLSRPFGKSRISRAVMALTDSGVRTLLRSEVSAEFFSAPQRYALGVDEDTFIGPDGKPIPAWQAVIGRMFAVGRDENGDLPSVGQFSQQSFEPHFAQIRQLASLVSSEFNMTPRSFGIVQDNPESADAIIEAKEDLVLDAKEFTDTVSPAWKRLVVGALRIHDDSPAAREVYRQIRPHFRNPALPSVVSASDAVTKQVSSFPWLAETDEALEMLGYDRQQIDSMQATRRRASARQLLTQGVVADPQEV